MGLVGLFAYLYRDKRDQGLQLNVHRPTLERDLLFFLVLFAIAGAAGLGAAGAAADRRRRSSSSLAYVVYIALTLKGGGEVQSEESLNPLIFERRAERREDPALALCVLQLLVGLGAMVGGAHLFVEELLNLAESIGVEPLVLALILAPLATELPEKVNSFFWVREGKDALALGNITGAMVFQSMIPVGIGLIFTDWELSWQRGPLDRPRPRRRPARLREPAPGAALQTAGGDRLVRALRGVHRGRDRQRLISAQAAASSPSAFSTRSSCFFG